MPGTHRSLLQTGGRKEARFSATQVLTLTGRSMALPGAVLPAVFWGLRGGAVPPTHLLAAWLIGSPGVKGRGNPLDTAGAVAGDPRGGPCQPVIGQPWYRRQAPARPRRTSWGGAPHTRAWGGSLREA